VNGSELVALLDRALPRLAESRDELRDLDAAVGDGDLGITVSKGCDAAGAKLAELGEAQPAVILRTLGAAVATANPSTFAALTGGGLLAAAKAIGEASDLDRTAATLLVGAIFDSVAARGKAALGDKTVLDAMAPSIEALERSDGPAPQALAAMVAAARDAVEATAALQSRRGRASWLGERSTGHPDPGATAYLRLLEALAASWPVAEGRGEESTTSTKEPQ
jgi:dihydroxyacetone kinase-like protein